MELYITDFHLCYTSTDLQGNKSLNMQILFEVHISLEDQRVTFLQEVRISTHLLNVGENGLFGCFKVKALGNSWSLFVPLSPLDSPILLLSDVMF